MFEIMGSVIPVRIEKVTAAFESDEAARGRLCESSGSEHWPESFTDDLSDLVKSFMEKNSVRAVQGKEDAFDFDNNDDRDFEWYDYEEKKDILKEIFGGDYDFVKEKIRREVELAIQIVGGDKSSSGFKRIIMSRLRESGFDAGKNFYYSTIYFCLIHSNVRFCLIVFCSNLN